MMNPSILVNLVVAQAAEEVSSAPAWVEYLVYGGIVALILLMALKGMRGTPPAEQAPLEHDQPDLTHEHKTREEIEAEARKAFHVPQLDVGAEPGDRLRMRMAAPEAATVTRDEAPPPPPEPEPEPEPAAALEPAAPPAPAPARAAAAEPPAERIEAAGKTLREGLSRTHDGFVKKLGKIFGGAKTIDDDLLADLEEALFTADIGVRTSQKLVELVHEDLGRKDLEDPAKVWKKLKRQITELLATDAAPLDWSAGKPFVLMVVGVNGAGKTTTIGKLSRKLRDEGKKVILAAGDTFRAAAVEQLEVWADRAGVPVVKGREGQDPSSVIFDACKRATDEGFDVVIADTAGRLQAKKELMDELAKVHRVCGKAVPGGPHEVWLVLDSTNGQNAISQAKEFTAVVDVTGVVLTKLDGTAKGGVVIGISDEMRLPVRYIGIGEKVEDLREFDPEAFAEALFAEV